MSLSPGQELELAVEKPAAGGRMIARHEGQVVLVLGALPGERVRALVSRVERQLAFAEVSLVIDASPDRRPAGEDPLCGGCLYAHAAYARQLALKAEVIHDAFARLGRIPLERPVEVAPSPERGYRMRARLHVRGGRAGFYREGTHDLCDPRTTGQLTDAAVDAIEEAVNAFSAAGTALAGAELTENLAGDERVLHLSAASGADVLDGTLEKALHAGALTGCSMRDAGLLRVAGVPTVSDPLDAITGGRVTQGSLQRHAESFFQANRFLLPQLVGTVLDAVLPDGEVLDLYAGVGLFSVPLAAAGRSGIRAVEGDHSAGRDLQRNAAAFGPAIRVLIGSVEDYLRRPSRRAPATVLVDPPRTGISRPAMQAVVALGARRVVYVSCDPATMARDARRLIDGGYGMRSLTAFDLFPGTPHVESVGVFDRAAGT